MTFPKEFLKAVENKKILRIRIMLKDSLLVDPTAAIFDEMVAYVESQIGTIYDVHDGELLKFDEAEWDKDYLNELMVEVVNNFSEDRIALLKKMVVYLFPEKVAKVLGSEHTPQQVSINLSKRKTAGIGVTAAGAAIAVAGVVTSHTFVVVGGVAVAAAGIALIATDKEGK